MSMGDNAFDIDPNMASLRRRLTDLEGKTRRITALESEVTTLKATVAKLGSATAPSVSTVNVNGVTRHGALTGLDVDDHLQYFNQLRGDDRYDKRFNVVYKTHADSPYFASIDEFVICDCTGGIVAVNLPDGSDVATTGHGVGVLKLDTTGNQVAIGLLGGDAINLPNTPVDLTLISRQFGSLHVISDGLGVWSAISYGAADLALQVQNTLSNSPTGSSISFDFSSPYSFVSLYEWQNFIFRYLSTLASSRQRIVNSNDVLDPDNDDVLLVDCSGGNITITLPLVAAWIVSGGNTLLIRRPVSICRTDTSGNTLTLAAAGGETVTDLAGTTGATASILVGECWTGTINDGDPTTATGWRPI